MKVNDLRRGIDAGFPTLLTLQAYRESSRPYRELWGDGHWVVAIGYDRQRILFEDPSAFRRTWLADDELHQRWHDIDRGNRIWQWGCTVHVGRAAFPISRRAGCFTAVDRLNQLVTRSFLKTVLRYSPAERFKWRR